ncbi:MAG: LamG domain-containing protein [Deltaproteobacteria bacterium]|nr:LamG domain-containing protein [Deltaproteobacteria bacterium]
MAPVVRAVGGVVGASLLVAGMLWLRHYVQATQPEAQPAPAERRLAAAELPRVRRGVPGGAPMSEPADEPAAGSDFSPRLSGGMAPPRMGVTPGAAPKAPGATSPQRGGAAAATDAAPAEPPAAVTPETGLAAAVLSVSFDGTTSAADQTPPLIEQDVTLDPKTGAAFFPPTAVLAYADAGGVDPDQGTVALWVRRETDPADGKERQLISLLSGGWPNRLELGMGPTAIRFMLTTSDGRETPVGSGIKWGAGEWHHVALTWGEALLSIYLDGMLSDQGTYAGTFALPPGTALYVASSRKEIDPAAAPVSLRSLLVLQYAASWEEIAQIVTETVPPH